MFPYEKPKQTAVGIASWRLSSAVLHIGFSRELSNVAHLDAQLFKTGMRLALTTRNGKRLLQSILSHLGVEPLLRMPWTQRCRIDRAMSYSALTSRDGLPLPLRLHDLPFERLAVVTGMLLPYFYENTTSLKTLLIFLPTKFRSQKPNSFGPPIHRFWTHGC